MNQKKPTKALLFFSILLIIINMFISYIFNGGNIPFVIGNVFGLTMIVVAISYIFPQYRNQYSVWLIILNTMIITFIMLVSNIFMRASDIAIGLDLNKSDIVQSRPFK